LEQENGALGPLRPKARREASCKLRIRVADHHRETKIPPHPNNGDEERYAKENYYANYSKGLPHNQHGEVEREAYQKLLRALESGRPEDFERLPAGVSENFVKFTDPQAGLAYDLEGIDSHQLYLRPSHAFHSAEIIAEIAENYWLALCRDVAFADYDTDPTVNAAAKDLNRFSSFEGPSDPATGQVSSKTVFRGNLPGDLAGPYLSQFFIRDIPYGPLLIPGTIAFALPDGTDYLTDESEYLAYENGTSPSIAPQPITPHHIRSGRDLGSYVHIDELYEEYLNACLLLIAPKSRGGLAAPIGPGNPYAVSKTQTGFGTLGEPNYKALVAEVSTRALKAVWFQKWFVHRRLRPEEFGGRLHWHFGRDRKYDFHPKELAKLRDGVLDRPEIQKANYFLPMAFPEGCPTHPSYGQGHATVAGACVTVLKALFQEDVTFSELGIPVLQPKSDGSGLEAYTGSDAGDLTVGGELNKLASNVGMARDFAGVHWRSDYRESVTLGEEVALYFLSDYIQTYNEDVFFELTRFDGTKVKIEKGSLFRSAAGGKG
jgi:hypothetical protein